MALRITKANEPISVEQLVVCIYGPPGVGKSTLGFSASRPLVLDFDRGAYRAANRGDCVEVNGWPDVAEIKAEDLEGYDTVVVDTAERLIGAALSRAGQKRRDGDNIYAIAMGILSAKLAFAAEDNDWVLQWLLREAEKLERQE